ncbi:ATP-binding protein [Planctomycetaceae bacterium]|nr:ATP-binding protein [Planctomycetaceae bacterium]
MSDHDFEISFSSDTAKGQEVRERIISAMDANGFSEKDVFGMRLSLEEALVNAIKHGNGMDPNKEVHVTCHVDYIQTRITIRDEGTGFDPRDIPDPTDEDNLEKPGGRGIMLMKAFMTEVSYSDDGNEVLLVKEREVETEDDSSTVVEEG